jgi:hypothetical protein
MRAELGDWTEADLRAADQTAREVVQFIRDGAVEFNRSRVRTWTGDPLAPLLGLRLLREAASLEDVDALEPG